MDNQRLIKQLLIWGGLLVFLLAVLWGYKHDWWQDDFNGLGQKQAEMSRQEIDAKMADIGYYSGYRIYLADVSGGEGQGESAYHFMNDQYEHLVVAELPEAPKGYFYEAWLIRTELRSQVSMGQMFKQVDGRYTSLFQTDWNYSDYNQVVVTLEPDDGNPEPAQSILKGGYK